jgi:hypothetical protein
MPKLDAMAVIRAVARAGGLSKPIQRDTLFIVKRLRDGRGVDLRVFDDGEVQLRWCYREDDRTRMSRAAAQCVAAVMTVADENGDIIIEEAE